MDWMPPNYCPEIFLSEAHPNKNSFVSFFLPFFVCALGAMAEEREKRVSVRRGRKGGGEKNDVQDEGVCRHWTYQY